MNAGGEGRKQRIITATGRKPRSPPVQTTDQLQPDLKLENGIELIKSAWSDMKEKERELNQMRTENQYLRKTLDELHRNIIDGGRMSARESKVISDMQDDQLIKAVEAITMEVKQKFDETKAESEYAARLLKELNKYSGYEGISINLPGPPLQKLRDSSKERNKGVKKQDVENPRSEHDEQQQNNFKTASRVLQKMMYVDYAARLLEELDKYSVYKGKQITTVSLPKPPIPKPRAVSKDNKKEDKGQNAHVKQLEKNFETASSVLEKLINATSAQEERECLLLSLEHLSHVRDPSDGNTEVNILTALDQIQSSVKKDSSVYKGLIHAKDILLAHMDVRRNVTSAQEERDCLLLSLEHLSHVRDPSDGNTEVKITTALDQIQSLVKKDSSVYKGLIHAKDILLAHMDVRRNATSAQEDRDCLLLSLEHLSHVRDPSDGNTDVKITTALDQISVKRESSINKGLIHAKEILVEHMDVRREADYTTCLLQELNKYAGYDGKHDTPIRLTKPPIQTVHASRRNERKDPKKHNEQLQQNFECASSLLEKLRIQNELDRKAKLAEETKFKLQKIQNENENIKKEAESLRTRLSEHVALAVTHENPAITDLSDANRPTKLAEKYSEIYDNQWTDAFENISKLYKGTSDTKIAEYLYGLLVDCYNFCKDVREKQKKTHEDIMLYPPDDTQSSQTTQKNEDFNKLVTKALTDAAKMSGNVTGANIAKIFLRSDELKEKDKDWTKVCETYIECCVQICWLMQGQTPPVCIDLKTTSGQRFDKNVYREYTRIGKNVAFVVWPALLLHEKGPTLFKGVAQGQ